MRFIYKIWFENGAKKRHLFCATATAPLFFNITQPRRAPPFLVRSNIAVALKVAQVPSTGSFTFVSRITALFFQSFISILPLDWTQESWSRRKPKKMVPHGPCCVVRGLRCQVLHKICICMLHSHKILLPKKFNNGYFFIF